MKPIHTRRVAEQIEERKVRRIMVMTGELGKLIVILIAVAVMLFALWVRGNL